MTLSSMIGRATNRPQAIVLFAEMHHYEPMVKAGNAALELPFLQRTASLRRKALSDSFAKDAFTALFCGNPVTIVKCGGLETAPVKNYRYWIATEIRR